MKNGTTVFALVASAASLALAAPAGCAREAPSGGAGGAGAGTTGAATSGSASSSGSGGAGGSGGGSGVRGIARFPDTSASIGVLVDQLPGGMSAAQQQLAAKRFVGSQKLTLEISGALRAIQPDFVVLHYHLAMWQSAPGVNFILDGKTWGNDYPKVGGHESWFWHTTGGQRVTSVVDGKWLMNVADPGFQGYWIQSITQQIGAGEYDGVFLDSASPALLQSEAQAPPEPRLTGTGARDNLIPELGNKTFIQAWTAWIATLDAALGSTGLALIPNTGAFITGWDDTPYDLTAGVFSEGYADPSFAEADWKLSTNQLLGLAAKGKIMILQNYLSSPDDVARRVYYLGNYLLVRGKHTYLDYFASGPMEWYPEWGIDLGAAVSTGAKVDDLLKDGVYRRDFEKGIVLVNPTASPVTVTLPKAMQRVVPAGGGAVEADGVAKGTLGMTMVTSVDVAAKGAEILIQ
jgi:putative glycosyl hydrolase-like family 15 (GHL15) protein